MALYVETSAILAWLYGEPEGSRAIDALNLADRVVTSALTILETERSLVRAVHGQVIKGADAARLRGLFRAQHLSWEVMEVSETVRGRAAQPYPAEPVRSLDAIHLATMLTFQELYDPIRVLSFDSRILANLEPLGLEAA